MFNLLVSFSIEDFFLYYPFSSGTNYNSRLFINVFLGEIGQLYSFVTDTNLYSLYPYKFVRLKTARNIPYFKANKKKKLRQI